ncbi:hypothetical protein L2E76_22645 [Planktothrix agardhii 1811]|uniref:Uncharacterized protein n=1 Tax=Planktothrix agardhii TaxID=1160 RepID=A0A1J1JPQ2_PLAAG|nr:hypothetical protein [Planktothrix agardhii 1811]CUM62300.1 protein of unknown function [Planktothrix agardhii]
MSYFARISALPRVRYFYTCLQVGVNLIAGRYSYTSLGDIDGSNPSSIARFSPSNIFLAISIPLAQSTF